MLASLISSFIGVTLYEALNLILYQGLVVTRLAEILFKYSLFSSAFFTHDTNMGKCAAIRASKQTDFCGMPN